MANNLPIDKKAAVISALCEGVSIRAIERMTGIHRDTIMRLGVRVGEACGDMMNARMRGLGCRQIEVDEIWGFIGKKRNHVSREDVRHGLGDVWTFIALDAETKLIPSYLVGQRDRYHAQQFMEDLAGRLKNRVQLSTDSLSAYINAVDQGFGSEVDYAQVVKTYVLVNLNKDAASRYSPAQVARVERLVFSGNPNRRKISTSHVEKQNHTLRMHCRRLTRLTNGFSKKLENFKAAVSLNFAYYNFCKVHIALRTTPAQAASLEPSIWTVADLLEQTGIH